MKKFCTKCKIEANKAACKRYGQSEKGEATRKRWATSEKGRASHVKAQQVFKGTEKGRVSKKKHQKIYRATINGYLRGTYSNMKQRCTNPNDKRYHRYGGRGIKLCFTSTEFVNYVVNELKVDPRGLQVDRIDNDGNYESGNIQFVTNKENCQNQGVRHGI